MRALISLAMMLLLPFCAMAQEGAGCVVTVEVNDQWRTLRLRASQPSIAMCAVSEAQAVEAIGSQLSGLSSTYDSLFLGRLVEYPWLSDALARAAAIDPAWDAKAGRARKGSHNEYVARWLERSEKLAGIRQSLRTEGYDVTGVSVEKVLLRRASSGRGRVPFDAMVWLRLNRL